MLLNIWFDFFIVSMQGDLMTPPDVAKKQKTLLQQSKRTIRGRYDSDDSDIDFDD